MWPFCLGGRIVEIRYGTLVGIAGRDYRISQIAGIRSPLYDNAEIIMKECMFT